MIAFGLVDWFAWTAILVLGLLLVALAARRPDDQVEPMSRRDVDRFLRWIDQERREHPERES